MLGWLVPVSRDHCLLPFVYLPPTRIQKVFVPFLERQRFCVKEPADWRRDPELWPRKSLQTALCAMVCDNFFVRVDVVFPQKIPIQVHHNKHKP